jgi:hypothetical protein
MKRCLLPSQETRSGQDRVTGDRSTPTSPLTPSPAPLTHTRAPARVKEPNGKTSKTCHPSPRPLPHRPTSSRAHAHAKPLSGKPRKIRHPSPVTRHPQPHPTVGPLRRWRFPPQPHSLRQHPAPARLRRRLPADARTYPDLAEDMRLAAEGPSTAGCRRGSRRSRASLNTAAPAADIYPAIWTDQVAKLEADPGPPLLIRGRPRRSMQPTEHGRALLALLALPAATRSHPTARSIRKTRRWRSGRPTPSPQDLGQAPRTSEPPTDAYRREARTCTKASA